MTRTAHVQLVRGDAFTLVVRLNIAGFDWTDVSVQCQLRTLDSRLVWDFAGEGGIATEVDADGKFVITLNALGADTRGWPAGRLCGDVQVERSANAWGPYTPAAFRLNVLSDTTR